MMKLNPMAQKHSDKVRLCFENLSDIEIPNSGGEFYILMDFFYALEKGELSQELFDKFKKIENSQNCWKKLREILVNAEYRGRDKAV